MAEAARRLVTADEFLAFEGEGDTRYELIDGAIVARATESDAHGTIVGNAGGEIARCLESRPPCRAVASSGIRLDERNHYKADLAATCAEPDAAPYVREPFLIVEVLSATTAKDDLAVKLPRYIALPSVREIWLIDSRERWVQVWRRGGEAWIVSLPLRGPAIFRSDALGDEIALDRLYRNSGL